GLATVPTVTAPLSLSHRALTSTSSPHRGSEPHSPPSENAEPTMADPACTTLRSTTIRTSWSQNSEVVLEPFHDHNTNKLAVVDHLSLNDQPRRALAPIPRLKPHSLGPHPPRQQIEDN